MKAAETKSIGTSTTGSKDCGFGVGNDRARHDLAEFVREKLAVVHDSFDVVGPVDILR
jgi:hypothetical protein